MYALICTWTFVVLGTSFFTVWVLSLLYSAIWAFVYYADKRERSITFLKRGTIWERMVINNRFTKDNDDDAIAYDTLMAFTWILPVVPLVVVSFIAGAWPLMIAALPLWFLFYVIRAMLDVHKMKNPQQP